MKPILLDPPKQFVSLLIRIFQLCVEIGNLLLKTFPPCRYFVFLFHCFFKLFATNVVIKIPLPKNTAVATVSAASGKCKYEPEQGGVIWKLRRFPGDTEYFMSGEVEMMATMGGKTWSRPPITMDFQVPMFAASGLHVRFLKVFEKSNYQTIKWVRYITKAASTRIGSDRARARPAAASMELG